MRKSYKQFMLVIDWLHPLPEGHQEGYNYEFFDSLDELKKRAEKLLEVREEAELTHEWDKPGIPHHVVAMKATDCVSSKRMGFTVVLYEEVAVLWGLWRVGNYERGWIVKEWCYEKEWKEKKSAVENLEAIYNYEDGKLLNIDGYLYEYKALKESKKQKVC